MKKTLLLLLMLTLSLQGSFAQTEEQDRKMKWWREARFGMFIHWGPYSILGGVYNGYLQRVGGTEWIMNRCKIPVKEYQEITKTFNPVKYDAEAWVKMAKDAGMKYLIITAKHHDASPCSKPKPANTTSWTLPRTVRTCWTPWQKPAANTT